MINGKDGPQKGRDIVVDGTARILWPYFLGSDNPIPYLFEKIGPFFPSSEFDIHTFSDTTRETINKSNINEIYTYEPNTLNRWIRVLFESFKKYDLIHTGGIPNSQFKISKVTRLRNWDISHIHTFRVDVTQEQRNSVFDINYRRKLKENADVVTAVSQHTASTVEEAFGVEPLVIYNGVDTSLFRPDYDRPSKFDELGIEDPIFLFVGTLESRKHPKDVVEVAKRVEDATFLLIGNGPLLPEIGSEAQNLDNLFAVGRIKKELLPPIYANAAGLIFPSTVEGCPNVVLEAMASGIPVIGYEATSMPELVDEGETGYLAPSEDVEGLVEAVHVTSDPEMHEELGKAAREFVRNNHTFDVIGPQYRELYRQVLDRNSIGKPT